MSVRAIYIPLLLLGLFACTEKERLPLATAPTGFTYAGRLVTREATVTTRASYGLRASGPNSYATVDTTEIVSLTLTAALAKDPPALLLSYERLRGHTIYHPTNVIYLSGKDTDAPVFFTHITGTLRQTSDGSFEGAFTNTKPDSSPLSEGRFTHVPVVKRY